MNNGERFDKLDNKLDVIDSRIDNIDKILAVNTEVLAEHQRRSTTLENRFISELKPIKAHVALVTNGFKVVVWICMALAGILGVVKMVLELGLF